MSGNLPRLDADEPNIRVHGWLPYKEQSAADIWLFRKWDQVTLAAALFLALASLSGFWFYQWQTGSGAIELQRFEPQTADFQLDINKADWPEFAVLPGIGEEKARAIVDFRDANGSFSDISDLRRVRGIGPKILEQVRPYVYAIPDVETTASR